MIVKTTLSISVKYSNYDARNNDNEFRIHATNNVIGHLQQILKLYLCYKEIYFVDVN